MKKDHRRDLFLELHERGRGTTRIALQADETTTAIGTYDVLAREQFTVIKLGDDQLKLLRDHIDLILKAKP